MFNNENDHLLVWREITNISFTICTWPNWPVGANILSGFQIEGKTYVWISQVRRVKLSYPVHGNDKVLVGFNRLHVKKYYSYEMKI